VARGRLERKQNVLFVLVEAEKLENYRRTLETLREVEEEMKRPPSMAPQGAICGEDTGRRSD
jgi:hypothetical protein